ncbi:MAG: type II secretion system F family protein [Gammaproteobacteria bacterium]|nr:type II secretion system F family protein [Gammaproteobacteria bacterium]
MALAAVKKDTKIKPAGKAQIEKTYSFSWEGTDKKGERLKGELQGANAATIKAQLRKQGIVPLKVNRKASSLLGKRKKAIKPADIAVMSRQLATMMQAGVPLVQSFEIIGRGHENPSMQELILTIKGDVEAGNSMAESLKRHPRYFDDLFCDLVAAGEQSGALEQMLDRIATYKEKTESLKAKVKKALFYPAAVIVVAVIVTAILLVFVVPMFQELFQGFGAELPAFTLLVIGISEALQTYWYIVLGAIVAGAFAFKEAHFRSPAFRNLLDRALLKIPVLGAILNKSAVARYARTLSTTFAAGVPLVEALDSAAGASGNDVYRRAILRIKDDVATGMQMNMAMQSTGVFPNMVNQMVAIGEEAGALDSMLAKVASIYEEEVDNLVDSLSSLLEPMIMVIIGGLVGSLIVAMYLPIFQMGQVV